MVIARSGITTYGRYVQALRELYGRYRMIRGCTLKLEELRLDLIEHDIGINTAKQELAVNRAELAMKRSRIAFADEQARLAGLCYEFSRYYVNALALSGVLGELTQGRVEAFERELMVAQVRVNIAKGALEGRSMSPETWQLVCALPPEDRVLVGTWLKDSHEKTVLHFLEMPEPFPELEPSEEEVASLGSHVVQLVAENPEIDYGVHTYRSNGLSAADDSTLRGAMLQNHPS